MAGVDIGRLAAYVDCVVARQIVMRYGVVASVQPSGISIWDSSGGLTEVFGR